MVWDSMSWLASEFQGLAGVEDDAAVCLRLKALVLHPNTIRRA